MYCSAETIELIEGKIDIVDFISKDVELRKKDNFYVGQCPFHPTKIKSLFVDEEERSYSCFECGRGGTVIDYAMHYYKKPFTETLRILSEKCKVIINETDTADYIKKQKRLISINSLAIEFYKSSLGHNHRAQMYLSSRSLSENTIEKFQLGYAYANKHIYDELLTAGYTHDEIMESGLVTIPNSEKLNDENSGQGHYDKFYSRIIFPILNEYDVPIGFGGRILTDRKPKYINSPETMVYDKSSNVFGLNLAKHSKQDYFLICEGYMDVIAMHQAGFDNAVASLGTALTQNQVRKLSKYKRNFILAYDSDEAGINAVKRAIQILKQHGINARVISLKPWKDPDEFIKEYGKEQFSTRIQNAIPVDSWLVNTIFESESMSYDLKLQEIAALIER